MKAAEPPSTRYHLRMAVVVNWNGKEVPDELRSLPSGRYVLESVDAVPALTDEEEAGLHEAMSSLDRAEGLPAESVFNRIESKLRR